MATSGTETRYILKCAADGSIGYENDGIMCILFGQQINSSNVKNITMCKTVEHSVAYGHQNRFTQSKGSGKSEELPSIIFEYDETGGAGGEAVYSEIPWHENLTVRDIHSSALVGRGMLLESNKSRVFVVDRSIPSEYQTIKRGYLKVEAGQVDYFLERMRWASRCEGIGNAINTKSRLGNTAQVFVIKDKTSFSSVAYYVACNRSAGSSGQMICHLEPIGNTKDMMRKVVWKKGERLLGEWALRKLVASSLLFD